MDTSYEAYRMDLVGLVAAMGRENGLDQASRLLLLHYLNSEEKIVKFVEWAETRMNDGHLEATETEICRAAVKIKKGLNPME